MKGLCSPAAKSAGFGPFPPGVIKCVSSTDDILLASRYSSSRIRLTQSIAWRNGSRIFAHFTCALYLLQVLFAANAPSLTGLCWVALVHYATWHAIIDAGIFTAS